MSEAVLRPAGLVLFAGLVLQGAWGLRRRRAPPVPEVLP
jgi:hypothetical protein